MRRYIGWLVLAIVVVTGVSRVRWQDPSDLAEQEGGMERQATGLGRLFARQGRRYVTWDGCKARSAAKVAPASQQTTASYRCLVRYRSFNGEPTVASVTGGLATFEYFGETQGYTYYKYFADPPDTVYLRIPQHGRGIMEFGYTYVSETRKVPPGRPKRQGAAFEAANASTETAVTLGPIGVAEFGREAPGTGTWNPLPSHTVFYPGTPPPLVFAGQFAPDDWHGIGRYAVAFDSIKLRGCVCDLSSPATRPAKGADNLWLEGWADGSLGLWGASVGEGAFLSWRHLPHREGTSAAPSRHSE